MLGVAGAILGLNQSEALARGEAEGLRVMGKLGPRSQGTAGE